jgi:hypothetical protein
MVGFSSTRVMYAGARWHTLGHPAQQGFGDKRNEWKIHARIASVYWIA